MFFFLGFDLDMTIDRVLIESEGPQLCSGTDFSGQRWLVFRSRSDAEESIWLCSPLTERALLKVETGRAAPRDAMRHSSTGLVEVVSYRGRRVVPEKCLGCAEIPESLLPPGDLRVPASIEMKREAVNDRSTGRRAATHADPPGPAPDARSRTPDESPGAGAVLYSAA
jgi:hypothetical protein